VKPGGRALGVAESYPGDADTSTLAGAVVRADRAVDGFVFGACTVGGTDATDAVVGMVDRLDRPDVGPLFVAGVAPAWFNVLDLRRIHRAVDRPVLSVSFEDSPGLEGAIREAFDGRARADRLATYRAQPPRERVAVGDGTCWVRAVGCDTRRAREAVRAFTPEGGRPEPVRVARLAARAASTVGDP